jgi:hypothetical protein
MKTKLLLITFIATVTLSFSQNTNSFERNKTVNYYLINKLNDTIIIPGKILPIINFQCGFTYNDTNEKKIIVNPDFYKYLIYESESGESIKLKSLPKQKIIRFCDYKNNFMEVLIENSEEDLRNGKVDFYSHQFTSERTVIDSYDDSGISKSLMNEDTENFYLKDKNGMHQINSKSQFKQLPKILGKRVYREMMRSIKGQKQFLLDYITAYNRNL